MMATNDRLLKSAPALPFFQATNSRYRSWSFGTIRCA